MSLVGVVGAGAWGTALANAAARAGRDVVLLARDAERADAIATARQNASRLPGIPLAEGIAVSAAPADLAGADMILLVAPAQEARAASRSLAGSLGPEAFRGRPVIACAKGIERGTGLFPSEVVAACFPGAVPAVLSGPSFAEDVGRNLPTALVLAAANLRVAAELAGALGSAHFRVYHSGDVRGVEIGGAAKNVLAIAAGIVAGRGLGESAGAALTARGFAELTRLAVALGGRPETLMGLSGLGDLILTCGSARSRNFAYGRDLGRGLSRDAAGGGRLAEGALTARALVATAREHGIAMPIVEAVEAVVSGESSVDEAIGALLARPARAEA